MQSRLPLLPALGAILTLLAGCAVTVSPAVFRKGMTYTPERVAERFNITVRVTAGHTMTPEIEAYWHGLMNSDASIANYNRIAGEQLVADIVESGLFTHPVTTAGRPADFELQLTSQDFVSGGIKKMSLAYVLRDLRPGSPRVINQRQLTLEWGRDVAGYSFRNKVPGAMNMVKESVTADLKKYLSDQRLEREKAETAQLATLGLADLLVGSERSVGLARARNRALVAAKTTQLSGLLRNSRTDDLTALVVKIEQTILDLNHECEVAKDRAQQILASGGDDARASADDLRDLAISYRERIELLKPVAAAIKEEIANRNR